MFEKPDAEDFKEYFFRDFPYTNDMDYTGVTTQDICKAMREADVNFNTSLFSTQAIFTLCYLYLTAHYLVTDLRQSSQGISGQYDWLVSSKGVGSVSEGISIPDSILKNPQLAMFSKTTYGAKYLSLVYPLMSGQMFSVQGTTRP